MICITSAWRNHSNTFHPKLQLTASRLPVLTTKNSPQGVTLFLEHSLCFLQTVHFHGDLTVVALRPLDLACVSLGGDGFVEPGAVLRLAGCQNDGDGEGGAMWVRGNLDVRGELHIRDSWAKKGGGSLGWSFFCSVDICGLSCEDAGKDDWLDSKLPKGFELRLN